MTTVLAHGCFDLLHYGHLRHLQAARALGDRLVVSVTTARYVNKGAGRPVFNDDQRREMLMALKCVDDVVLSLEATPEAIIRYLKPDIYVKGAEYRGKLPEQELVEALGGRVVFTDEPVYSSTTLIGKQCKCA